LSEEQATKLADWLHKWYCQTYWQLIVEFLTDRTIQLIDEAFGKRVACGWSLICLVYAIPSLASGRFVWMREAAECSSCGVNLWSSRSPEDMAENLSLKICPFQQCGSCVRRYGHYRSYLQTRGTEFLQGLSGSLRWENIASLL